MALEIQKTVVEKWGARRDYSLCSLQVKASDHKSGWRRELQETEKPEYWKMNIEVTTNYGRSGTTHFLTVYP